MAYSNLRAEMARIGVTQEDVAKTANVTTRTVNSWLNGEGCPRLNDAFSIRDGLFSGLSVDYLFDPSDQSR